jgi:hypothetical protein
VRTWAILLGALLPPVLIASQSGLLDAFMPRLDTGSPEFGRHLQSFLAYAASLSVTVASCLHLLGLNLASLRRRAQVSAPPGPSSAPAPVA